MRRRPFGIPSPCRKNEQENCRFTWDWQPRRPPASPPAAGKRTHSHHPTRITFVARAPRAHTRARPTSTSTSILNPTTHLISLTDPSGACFSRSAASTPARAFATTHPQPQVLALPLRFKRSRPRAYLCARASHPHRWPQPSPWIRASVAAPMSAPAGPMLPRYQALPLIACLVRSCPKAPRRAPVLAHLTPT